MVFERIGDTRRKGVFGIYHKKDERSDLRACKGRFIMDRERLEWIMSGLTRYNLTKNEDQFIVSAERDFNQKNMLTEQQEERLENLYKEKSRLIPTKNYLSPEKSSHPLKAKAKRFRPKFIPS